MNGGVQGIDGFGCLLYRYDLDLYHQHYHRIGVIVFFDFAATVQLLTPTSYSIILLLWLQALKQKNTTYYRTVVQPSSNVNCCACGATDAAGEEEASAGTGDHDAAGRHLVRVEVGGVLPEIQDRVPRQRHGVLPYRRQGERRGGGGHDGACFGSDGYILSVARWFRDIATVS